MIELATDTTRTIASVLFSGTLARCPNIRFIFSHAGGTLPFLTQRVTGAAAARKDVMPNGAIPELQKLYYDTAAAAHPYALSSLMKLVPISHVLFGTDFPFGTAENISKGLTAYGFGQGDRRAIDRENALRLFPRLNVRG
jgi:predicted TIM-barrel fold metal-dependent hydrolase